MGERKLASRTRSYSKLGSLRKPHANQYRRLGDIVVRVTHDANGARLHHHNQREIHRVLEPSFGESAEDVAMSDQQDIRSIATLYVWFL